MIMKNKMLTTRELAARWKVHPTTLANWRVKKKGPKYIKFSTLFNSNVFYKIADVIKFEKKAKAKKN